METANGNKSIWKMFADYWTPYNLAAITFFVLFAGADVSLYLFGKSATGNIFIALVLTLLSGVGALAWKRQRDHKDSNTKQRSIALAMVILHAVAAVIFLGGNFGKGGWETLAGRVEINGQLANELVDYYVVLQNVFTWSIVAMLSLDLIALFVFMEHDTEKSHVRLLAEMARNDKTAQLKAQEIENKKANEEYAKYSERLAKIRGLAVTRDRLKTEFSNLIDANTLGQSLAEIETEIALLTGATPVDVPSANSEAAIPFTQPPQTKVK